MYSSPLTNGHMDVKALLAKSDNSNEILEMIISSGM